MVETGTIIFILEIIIVSTMLIGAYYGRTLQMNYHHWLIYTAMIAQVVILATWMVPNFLFIVTNFGLSPLLGAHVFFGIITFLISLYLAIVFLKDRNEFDLKKLRRTRPLMITATFTWVTSFLIGVVMYLKFYVFV